MIIEHDDWLYNLYYDVFHTNRLKVNRHNYDNFTKVPWLDPSSKPTAQDLFSFATAKTVSFFVIKTNG